MHSSVNDWFQRHTEGWKKLPAITKGIACALMVTLSFAAMDAISKELSQTYEPLFVVWMRYITQAIGSLIIFAPRLVERLRTKHLGLQILRSTLLFCSTLMFFYGFAHLPLAEVNAIAQVGPLAITALAALILGERVGIHRWTGVAIGLLGALIIIRPGLGSAGWPVLFPLAGTLCFAFYNIATRFLGRDDSIWTTFLYTGLVGAVAASLFLPSVWQTPSITHLPLVLLIGVFGSLGQLMLVLALSYAAASLIAPFFYTSFLWAVLLGIFLFGEWVDFWTILGAGIIISAGLYVRHRELLRAKDEKKPAT